MLTLTSIDSERFEGSVDISDIPPELHDGLREYATQPYCASDGQGGRYAVIDFQGAALDTTPDPVVRSLLDGSLASEDYPVPEMVLEWHAHEAKGYAAQLLATRFLKTRLGSNVVLRDRVAIHVH